jgi:ATP-binding cassette subfamily B protein/subfamily B ATP-binding cassette protein MsbA
LSLTINHLSFAYDGKQILKNIDLAVKIGESVGIAGISGGGKSTLLKLISGLYEVQSGEILVMGENSSAKRLKNTAMVMQNGRLFPASIRDNITCGHNMDERAVLHACEAAQLCEWISSLPEGLDTFVGERGGKVSGGQAQRIAIARAMAKDAPVVLLDEPASALDSDTSAALIEALERLTAGKTVLHVSHRLENLTGCKRVLLLEGGRLYAP